MFPIAHKTVFVIDEGTSFVRTRNSEPVEFDTGGKSRQSPAPIPTLPPITKTLWSCAVEAVAEYCRIVWDIYPEGQRVISFARCSPNCRPVLSWSEEDQSLNSLMKTFIETSRDVDDKTRQQQNNSDLTIGLATAINILGNETPCQKSLRQVVINKGRIVLISHFRNDAQIMALQDTLRNLILEHNELCRRPETTGKILPIDNVDLVVINTFPLGTNQKITEIPNHSVNITLSVEVHSTPSGTILAQKLISLVLRHYSLASTTVTRIPMKEEQNASTSANYDVEIVHPKEVHVDIYRSGLADVVKEPKEGCEYFSIPLKWCTPRTTSPELHYTTCIGRFTTVDVNSRPSSCLTTFLLGNRTVCLEMTWNKTSKFMSHMLSSHNHELYIHALDSSRTILEDPPSISEGTGGRVTDYRITDFKDVMEKNRLTYCQPIPKSDQLPFQKAQEFLARITSYWPVVIGHTILFNIQSQIQPLVDLMPKESLTTDDVHNCKQAVYGLVSMESKGQSLPVPGLATKGKGSKKDEVYKLLYKELTHYLSKFSTTNEHREILTLFTGLTNTQEEAEKKNLPTKKSEDGSAFSHFANDSGAYSVVDEKRSTRTFAFDTIINPQESLLSFWTRRLVNKAKRKRPDFEGRQNGSNIAPLYVHLTEKMDVQESI